MKKVPVAALVSGVQAAVAIGLATSANADNGGGVSLPAGGPGPVGAQDRTSGGANPYTPSGETSTCPTECGHSIEAGQQLARGRTDVPSDTFIGAGHFASALVRAERLGIGLVANNGNWCSLDDQLIHHWSYPAHLRLDRLMSVRAISLRVAACGPLDGPRRYLPHGRSP
jgi:hypothetical protein